VALLTADLARWAVGGTVLTRHTSVVQSTDEPRFEWRGAITDAKMVDLVDSFGGHSQRGWWTRVQQHSLGWVTAPLGRELIGFVNVAWDGGDHAFLLDTKVHPDHRRERVGSRLVATAVAEARRVGCEWIEVDFDDAERLAPFYFDACGFRPTHAGLIHLRDLPNDDERR
jgi:GNAT superfamily N-acetyltransferase